MRSELQARLVNRSQHWPDEIAGMLLLQACCMRDKSNHHLKCENRQTLALASKAQVLCCFSSLFRELHESKATHHAHLWWHENARVGVYAGSRYPLATYSGARYHLPGSDFYANCLQYGAGHEDVLLHVRPPPAS